MIEVWIDGCCYPVNPGGTACAGYVIKKKGLTIAKGSRIIGKGKGMTNNVAEYQALITVLQEIKKRHLYTEEITIKSDSTLLVNQMNGNWKVKSQLHSHLPLIFLRLAKTVHSKITEYRQGDG